MKRNVKMGCLCPKSRFRKGGGDTGLPKFSLLSPQIHVITLYPTATLFKSPMYIFAFSYASKTTHDVVVFLLDW